MTRADMPQLAQILAMLAETFNEPVSELRAEGYYIALEDLEIDRINRGALESLKVCRFFPRPVEIRDLVLGTPEERAQREWDQLVFEVRRVGYIGEPKILDDITLEIISTTWGGWKRLCETLPAAGFQQLAFMKRFMSAYVAADRPVGRSGLPSNPPLLGLGVGDRDAE